MSLGVIVNFLCALLGLIAIAVEQSWLGLFWGSVLVFFSVFNLVSEHQREANKSATIPIAQPITNSVEPEPVRTMAAVAGK